MKFFLWLAKRNTSPALLSVGNFFHLAHKIFHNWSWYIFPGGYRSLASGWVHGHNISEPVESTVVNCRDSKNRASNCSSVSVLEGFFGSGKIAIFVYWYESYQCGLF